MKTKKVNNPTYQVKVKNLGLGIAWKVRSEIYMFCPYDIRDQFYVDEKDITFIK